MMSNSRCELLFSNSGLEDEINMRDELHVLFEKYSRWGLLRRIRRAPGGQLTLCPQCRKIGTQDHALYHICDKCLGIGYIWDEEWIKYYQWPGTGVARSRAKYKGYAEAGTLETNLMVIYLEAKVNPILEDKLIEVDFDDAGNPLQPYARRGLFDIRAIDDYRLDNGKMEYFRLACMKTTVGYYGQPLDKFLPGERRST